MNLFFVYSSISLFAWVSVVCGFPNEGSVEIQPQRGITITSAKLNSSNSLLPLWVVKQFIEIGSAKNILEIFPNHQSGQLCSVEMLGYTTLVKDPFFLTSKAANRDYSKMMHYVGNAEIIKINDKGIQIKCFYRVTEEGWRKTGISIYPSESTHKILFFYCPVYSSVHCKYIERLEKSTVKSKIQLKTSYHTSDGVVVYHKNTFVLNPVLNPVLRSTYRNELLVCSIRPYVSGHPDKQLVYDTVLKLWVRHYVNLGARVELYDASGNNSNLTLIDNNRVRYINTTIQRHLQGRTDIYKIDRHEVTGQYYVNGVEYLNGSYLGIANHYRKINNDDKVFTMTHCRFEALARYGIENVLVVDPDEFILCEAPEVGYSAQKEAILSIVSKAHTENGMQMYLPMIVPSFIDLQKYTVTECMRNAIHNSKSIFSCFSNAFIKNSEFKSIHFQFSCPITGYHQSCEDSSAVKSNNGCTCAIMPPSNECSLVHISHYTKLHREKAVVGKFSGIYDSRCPLEVLLKV